MDDIDGDLRRRSHPMHLNDGDGDGDSSGATDDTSGNYVRETWSGKLDFFVSALGYVVGLGNVCRFPYLCYKNGGGAFLLPYFIFVVLVGIPLVFLEVSFGQFAGLGPISIWNVAPVFKGVGMSMVVLSLVVSVYYNVLLSWAVFYLFASMQSPLPWNSCNNTWNTPACCTTRFYSVGACDTDNNLTIGLTANRTCVILCGDDGMGILAPASAGDVTEQNGNSTVHPNVTTSHYRVTSRADLLDMTSGAFLGSDLFLQYANKTQTLQSPAEEYFRLYVMGGTDFSGLLGGIRWHLALCLIFTTFVIFLCLVQGAHFSGKVTYVTVVSPYLILLVLLVKTSMLEGAKLGVVYYISPQWHRLKDPQVWHDAMNQVFFSLAPCYGGLLTLASFNKFHNNCYRDALLVPVGNCITSVFAGFPVFCTLGFMAHKLGTDISNVVSSGSGLAFIVYPEALSSMPGATFWSLLFFFMVFALGVDSLLGYVVTIVTAITDEWPKALYRWRIVVLMVVCVLLFILGLPLVTQGGVSVMELLDRYATSYPPVVVGLLECVVLMWVYGYTRFSQDVWYMFGKQPGRWWRLLWQFVTPALLLFLLVFSGVSQNLLSPNEGGEPDCWTVAGWTLAGLCILPVPLYAAYAAITTSGTLLERWRSLVQPADGWGVFSEGDSSTLVPDYIRSEIDDPEEVVPSVGDIPELSPRPVTTTQGLSDDHYSNLMNPPYGDEDDMDTGSFVWTEDENKERGNWHGRYDFLVAGLGYSVGLGNVWRFPYLVYKNGGGAFFLPYVLMLVFCGLPLFFMELSLGQFASVGSLSIWKLSPLFKGVGFASCLNLLLIAIYHNMLSSWSIYYFCASLTANLPWTTCGNTWNTPACRTMGRGNEGVQNTTGAPPCGLSGNQGNQSQLMGCINVTNITNPTSPSEEYFFRYMLNISSGIDELGTVQWPLALCLLASSVISFIAIIKGVKSIGKVVYVTVTFPYLILLVLLARYVTLGSHHLEGIKFYLTPQWSRLNDAAVWGDAASQLFFSLGLSMGGLMALSSYNRFHYDCYRDAYLICLVDTLTSVFAGFVIFAILGVMAAEKGMDIQNVVSSKFALAYIVYPEAVTKLPVAPFWSVLFFLMLFCLAVDTQFLMTACLVVSLTDEFPAVFRHHRVAVIGGVCAGLYLIGLPMTCQGGFYLVVLFDQYVLAWTPIVVAVLMCVVVTWVYGLHALINNVRLMLGSAPSLWWRTLWKYVTPLLLTLLLVFVWAQYEPSPLDDYHFPGWAHGLGILLGLAPLALIPLVAAIQLCRTPGFGLVIVRRCMTSTEGWGPALKCHRVNIFLPHLPDLEPTWSSNWLAMAKEMSIYATETSAIVALSAYNKPEVGSKTNQKKSKEKTVTITTSGSSSDKNIQTDGGLVDDDSVVVMCPRSKSPSRSIDASTQTLHMAHLEEDTGNIDDDACRLPDSSPRPCRDDDHLSTVKRRRKLSKESQASTVSLKSTCKPAKKGAMTEGASNRQASPDLVVVCSDPAERCHSAPTGGATAETNADAENKCWEPASDAACAGDREHPTLRPEGRDLGKSDSLLSGSGSSADISQGSECSIDCHLSADCRTMPDGGPPGMRPGAGGDNGLSMDQQVVAARRGSYPAVEGQVSEECSSFVKQQVSQGVCEDNQSLVSVGTGCFRYIDDSESGSSEPEYMDTYL